MELDISQNITKGTERNSEVASFAKELREEKEKLEIADKTFINELKKEFNLPESCLKELENKIDTYLKKYSTRCNQLVYIGYDLKTNTYYQDQYYWGEKGRFEISKKEAERIGVGTFNNVCYSSPKGNAKAHFEEVNGVKTAIRLSIKEQLKEGIDISDVDLFKLKDSFRECRLVDRIYDDSLYY